MWGVHGTPNTYKQLRKVVFCYFVKRVSKAEREQLMAQSWVLLGQSTRSPEGRSVSGKAKGLIQLVCFLMALVGFK